jgi:hypothetical protein
MRLTWGQSDTESAPGAVGSRPCLCERAADVWQQCRVDGDATVFHFDERTRIVVAHLE